MNSQQVNIELKVLMLRAGMTITDLAQRIGKSRENVSRCVNGQADFPVIKQLIADEFGVPVEKLFDTRRAA